MQATVVKSLENGKSYDFQLTASNSIGTGPPASVTGIKPTGDVPTTPTQVTAKEQPDGTVTVTWKEDAAGLSLTGYEIVATSDSTTLPSGSPTSKTFTVGKADATSYSTKADDLGYDDDSTPDWSATVKAKATKDGQPVESTASDMSNAVDPYNLPTFTGQTVKVSAVASTTITLTWGPAQANGRIVSYDVCITTCGSGSPAWSGQAMTAPLTGLTDGKQYAFEVRPRNDAGPAARGVQSPAAVPHAAPSVQVIRTGNNGYSEAYVSYQVNWYGMKPGQCSTGANVAAKEGTQCQGTFTFSGLRAETGVNFRICATNAVGESSPSCPTGTATSQTAPRTYINTDYTYKVPSKYCGGSYTQVAVQNGPAVYPNGSSACLSNRAQVVLDCETEGTLMTDSYNAQRTRWYHVKDTNYWVSSIWIDNEPTTLGLPICS